MTKHTFGDSTHEAWDDPEADQVETLTDQGVPEDVAWKIVQNHEPLYEVDFDFEYDTETETLRCTEVRFNDSGRSDGKQRRFVPAEDA